MKNKVKRSQGYLIRKMHVNLTGKPNPIYFKVTSIVGSEIHGGYSEDTADLKLMGYNEAVSYCKTINEFNPTEEYTVVSVERAKFGGKVVDAIPEGLVDLITLFSDLGLDKPVEYGILK